MNNFIITSVDTNEYPRLTAIWEAAVRATHHFLEESDIIYFRPLVDKSFPAVDLSGIRDSEGRLCGFLGVTGENLDMLFVDPAFFGMGLGRQLLEFAIDKKGIRKLDVNEQNPSAAGFYQHMGFIVISRSELDPQGKPFPILHMELLPEKGI